MMDLANERKKGPMLQETIERKFDIATPACLTIANIRGSVDVRPGNDGVVSVTAVKHLETGDPERTEIKIRQKGDGSVRIKTVFEKSSWPLSTHRHPCKVDYIVRVPRACALKVECVSSRTAVQGLEGEFDLETVSGRVTLRDLSGRIKATSVSGKIFGERLSGSTVFESVSGQVFLTKSHVPIIIGSSVSGDLALETPLSEGPYRFKTVSGDVKMILPSEASRCTVEFSSVSGRLKTSLPTVRSQRRRHRWHAELQGGGPEVRFSSISGNLTVMSSL